MSVLIKGMKMPKSCSSCGFMYGGCGDGYYCSLLKKTFDIWNEISVKRAKGCPLVEVKEPHGRLIDADAFDERVRVAGGMSEEELTEDFKDGVQTVLYMLSKQQSIIEAEGG